MQEFFGPQWDNADEYKSFEDKVLLDDYQKVISYIDDLEDLALKLRRFVTKAGRFTPPEANTIVPVMQEVYKKNVACITLLGNIGTFASCRISVNGNDLDAKTWLAKVSDLKAKILQAVKPLELIVAKASNDTISKYLSDHEVKQSEFQIERLRSKNDTDLSSIEEELIVSLSVNGFEAWDVLYNNLSGSIKCQLDIDNETKSMGLAAAASYLESPDLSTRKKAFFAINHTWSQHKETCAAALNAMVGSRLELNKRRSHTKKVHFLDDCLYQSRISRETLEAIMTSVADAKHFGQKTLHLQAKALGLDKLGPWDRFVPAPAVGNQKNDRISFSDACEIISSSFGKINPEMGNFVQMMFKNKWIEGSVGDAKRPGAYCTKFPKSRNPRVYMTYAGGMKDVLTLAHELGHAFHNWKLRDIPLAQSQYPMTLAETASIFSETVVNEALTHTSNSKAELFKIQWNVAREAEGMMLNVASRFTFEKEFYERRAEGFLNAEAITELMEKHWKEWYGNSLSEMDSYFWCSKLHFYISGLSFYNYPYIFGYLFSLGVYAQKEKLGTDFYDAYVRLLRDTGRMSAEDVAKKHLGVNLQDTKFWLQGIDILANKVAEFETSVNELF